MVLQGDVAEINCTHSITTYDRMFWYEYKAHKISGPELVISGYKSAEDKGPFKMTFPKDKLATSLVIQDVQITHSGTYYCAVNDTVTSVNKMCVTKPYTWRITRPETEQVSHPFKSLFHNIPWI
ncbi:hypothetical protein GDO86_001614 [Hymenochirus boettgeri]|uniref:Ig-like domain-containing protein n=1 Tax=Hymenochirus boettgeri TaxID=247094 RepID=A0A8T2KGE8_9PIPI|nr:hypothetical protein GDO86_001614 [Hymenochirus boettgeri]